MSDTLKHGQVPEGQTIIVKQHDVSESNGMGIAGFVLAIIGLFLGWIPIFGWIIWLLGLIFSSIGLFKKPKGLAIAGLVISLVALIFFIFVMAEAMSTIG